MITATSPLTHRWEELAAAATDQLRIAEIADRPMLTLRAVPGSPAAAVIAEHLGPLPTRCGEVSAGEWGYIYWIGPDEFLHVGPPAGSTASGSAEIPDDAASPPGAPTPGPAYAGQPAALRAAELMDHIGQAPGQVLDVTAQRTIISVAGPAAADILASSATVDLHDSAFQPGTAVATNFAQTQVVLHRVSEDEWWLLPRVSFADYVVTWLLDASAELRG